MFQRWDVPSGRRRSTAAWNRPAVTSSVGRAGSLPMERDTQLVQRLGPALVVPAMALLRVVDRVQPAPRRQRRVGDGRRRARRGRRELHVAPRLRPVHVDDVLGRPDPVVFLASGTFSVAAARDLESSIGRARSSRATGRRRAAATDAAPVPPAPSTARPARPTSRGRRRSGRSACRRDAPRCFRPGISHVDGRAAVLVGPGQQQIPDGAERVDLELVVLVVVAVGIDEDLEVVVAGR